MADKKELSKYIFWGIIIILILTSYYIIKPFAIAVLSAFILAFLLNPLNKRLSKNIKNKSLSSLITVILALSIIIIPITLILKQIAQQISESVSVSSIRAGIESALQIPILNSITINTEALAQQITSLILSQAKLFLTQIPTLFISITITIIGTYYILKNWEFLTEKLQKYIPFKDKNKVGSEIGAVTKNIVYGYLLVALIEFIISLIGFYFSGVKFFVLLPILIGILAFLPGLGPLLVWGPLAIFHLATGNYFTATGVIITGLIISILIDNILAPKLVGQRSNIHPFVMLVGVLGGITLFGMFGFIIGPIIIVYTLKLLEEAVEQD